MKVKQIVSRYLPEIAAYGLILLFVYAAVSKVADHENFTVQLAKSPLLTQFPNGVAWLVPISELIISALLASARYRMLGLYLSFSMLVMFTAYLIAILKFSFFIPCTCGGILQNLNWDTHIIFNSAFIILTAVAILASPTKEEKSFLLQ